MPDEIKSRNTYVASGPQAGEYGLDGEAVKGLLQGAVLKGRDPLPILHTAAIELSVYGNPHAAINGPALVRLSRQFMPGMFELHEEIMCRRRQDGTQSWNSRAGGIAPVLPRSTPQCAPPR